MPNPQQPPQAAPAEQATVTRVTVVESPACHYCADAHRVLAALSAAYPLIVDTVDSRTDAGRLLITEHRAGMSPLVLLDGAFFSHGRLPRRKLTKVLTTRYGGGAHGW
jgi:glutaredoxin